MMNLFRNLSRPESQMRPTCGCGRHLLAAGMIVTAASLSPIASVAKDPILIEPLFEYPAPPEEYDGLMERSDYLMDHFWDQFDFASSAAVDQNALNDAFGVYSTALQYASRDKALLSISNLIKRLKGNPVLLLQFTKSAEECMFGPRAGMWSDEAYMPFLKALVGEKKLPDSRKQRYAMQLDMLKRNAIGQKFPEIRIVQRDGRQTQFSPKAPLTLVEFGNPECDDCRFARTKLEMASDIMDMVEAKELEIAFVVADAVPEEQPELLAKLSDYPSSWVAGICYGGDDIFDIRNTPSSYIIDKNGRIIDKNLDATQAVDKIRRIR